MTPQEALIQFQQVTGLEVFAIIDHDGVVWWRKGEDPKTSAFECTVGDRVMHVDELSKR